MPGPTNLVLTDDDYAYEEDVMRNPYQLKSWWRYLQFKLDSPFEQRFQIYERALKELPRSYKLWFHYLQERMKQVQGRKPGDTSFEQVNNTFERALVYLNKMPRIWQEYCKFLRSQNKITIVRRTFDRALKALPITQHHLLWSLYIDWVKTINVPETAIKIFRRYLKLEPDHIEDYINFLSDASYWDEAAIQLANVVNKEGFVSKYSKSKHDLWMQLCDIISSHAEDIKSLKVEPIIRSGLEKFQNEIGKLWIALSYYYIRLGKFEKARDIFEEAIKKVTTVRDFTQIWDAYVQFEDSLVSARVQQQDEDETEEDQIDFEIQINRYEELLSKRALLSNSVLLRQNPHNVKEWIKRVNLYTDPIKKVETFSQAIKTIDPQQAKGKLQFLWINFARFYENQNKLDTARQVFERGLKTNFQTLDQLAELWCHYSEMELRNKNYERALEILRTATKEPPLKLHLLRQHREKIPVQEIVYKSTKLWSFYADLEESLGNLESTKAVYERIVDLKIATPQIILNYAQFLEENKYFEDSFKAYEKGVQLFKFPHSYEIWVTYLTKFVQRYKGKKLERARDLFEQAVSQVSAKDAKLLYVMYATLEEEHGLARHAMKVYQRATRAVQEDDKYSMYLLYIARAAEFFGVTQTREIFEQAIEALPEKRVKDMCLRYADMERKLGEIDRARAIYVHASQYCDPRFEGQFWKIWYDFEVQHGNEDTFADMLRIKRSVQAQYNTQVNIMSAQMLHANQKPENVSVVVGSGATDNSLKRAIENDMQALERRMEEHQPQTNGTKMLSSGGIAFQPASSTSITADSSNVSNASSSIQPPSLTPSSSTPPPQPKVSEPIESPAVLVGTKNKQHPTDTFNPEEINLEDDEGNDVELEQLKVPDAVFGSAKLEQEEETMGARERLRKKRKKA